VIDLNPATDWKIEMMTRKEANSVLLRYVLPLVVMILAWFVSAFYLLTQGTFGVIVGMLMLVPAIYYVYVHDGDRFWKLTFDSSAPPIIKS
jgi:positive regulator of sigma E activity